MSVSSGLTIKLTNESQINAVFKIIWGIKRDG